MSKAHGFQGLLAAVARAMDFGRRGVPRMSWLRLVRETRLVWVGALAVSVSVTALPMIAAHASEAAMRCHQLAADPDDPSRVPAVPGVVDGEIVEEAIAACGSALEEFSDDPVINYQLGRALLEWGRIDEAAGYLAKAAEAGQAAALYLYALLLRETGSAADDYVAQVLETSRQGGYKPAANALAELGYAASEQGGEEQSEEQAEGGQPALDYSAFEQPTIVKALVEGDVEFIRSVEIGIVAEKFSGAMGFLKYYEGLNGALSGPYFCPALLPAGAAAVLSARLANTTIDNTMRDPMTMFQPGGGMETILGQVETMFKSPQAYAQRQVAGETALTVMAEQGTKDGYVIKSLGDNGNASWGCNGDASVAIAQTVRLLMQ